MNEQPGVGGMPEQRTLLLRYGRRAMWLGGASLVLALFMWPLAIVTSILALVFGIRALRAARVSPELRLRIPGAVPGIVMGTIALAFSLVTAVFFAILYGEIANYSDCKATANTITDEQACKAAYTSGIERKLHLPKGSLKGMPVP